jgi:Uma2 family endonuclease
MTGRTTYHPTPATVYANGGLEVDDTVWNEESVVVFDTFDFETLVTEDDTPVDNILSEKQQRLLTEPLYSSWPGPGAGRTFLATANVGVFYHPRKSPIVPDVLVSLDVRVADNWMEKRHRTYVCEVFGKPPDVVIEIVSNREGHEDTEKVTLYSRGVGVPYYIIYDPQQFLSQEVVRIYERQPHGYGRRRGQWLEDVGLGVTLWKGTYEGKEDSWLRWCDETGTVIPTGEERAKQEWERAERERKNAERERKNAERERKNAEQERERAKQERERAEQEQNGKERALSDLAQEQERNARLLAKLRELGIEME